MSRVRQKLGNQLRRSGMVENAVCASLECVALPKNANINYACHGCTHHTGSYLAASRTVSRTFQRIAGRVTRQPEVKAFVRLDLGNASQSACRYRLVGHYRPVCRYQPHRRADNFRVAVIRPELSARFLAVVSRCAETVIGLGHQSEANRAVQLHFG